MPRPAFVVPALPDPVKGFRVSTKSKSEPDVLLSEQQAAERLGVSKWTVRRLRDEGQLPFVMVRHSVRIPASEVADYVTRQTVTAKT